MIGFLDGLDFRVGMYRSTTHFSWVFIEGLFHLLQRRLLLEVRVFRLHNCGALILYEAMNTYPSLRMILLAVYHLFLRCRRGSARWKPVLSKQVIPSSLLLAWMKEYILLWWFLLGRAAWGTDVIRTSCPLRFSYCSPHTLAERRPSL